MFLQQKEEEKWIQGKSYWSTVTGCACLLGSRPGLAKEKTQLPDFSVHTSFIVNIVNITHLAHFEQTTLKHSILRGNLPPLS